MSSTAKSRSIRRRGRFFGTGRSRRSIVSPIPLIAGPRARSLEVTAALALSCVGNGASGCITVISAHALASTARRGGAFGRIVLYKSVGPSRGGAMLIITSETSKKFPVA
eukprot:6187436-Pleurochrysis_carterae.AAC.9